MLSHSFCNYSVSVVSTFISMFSCLGSAALHAPQTLSVAHSGSSFLLWSSKDPLYGGMKGRNVNWFDNTRKASSRPVHMEIPQPEAVGGNMNTPTESQGWSARSLFHDILCSSWDRHAFEQPLDLRFPITDFLYIVLGSMQTRLKSLGEDGVIRTLLAEYIIITGLICGLDQLLPFENFSVHV